MLKINTLRTFLRSFLGARFALVDLFWGVALCAGLILAGCGEKGGGSVFGDFLPMEAAKLLKIGEQGGVSVVEVRSIVGRDTLVNRFSFNKPLARVVALSSSQVGFMSRLGVADRIVAVSDAKFIADSALVSRSSTLDASNESTVVSLGGGPSLSLERLVALKPDLVLDFATGGGQDDYERINAVGVPLMLTSEWQEESPLAKAEWIKLYGILFCPVGTECAGRADSIFAAESRDYKALQNAYGGISEDAKPRVIAGMSYGGVWYAPGGNSYTARLIADAGGRYLWASDSSRELRLSLETVLSLADSVDVWLNPGMFATADEILGADPRVAAIRAFRDKRICQNDGRRGPAGGNDFFEGAVARPAELLYNLSKCLHYDPSGGAKMPIMGNMPAISVDTTYKWYRNIYTF